MKKLISELHQLAERFAELATTKKFPIEKWLGQVGVNVDVLFPYETVSVKFAELELIFNNEEWNTKGCSEVLYSKTAIEKIIVKYQQVYDQFVETLPARKEKHIEGLQKQVYELMEELNAVAA